MIYNKALYSSSEYIYVPYILPGPDYGLGSCFILNKYWEYKSGRCEF